MKGRGAEVMLRHNISQKDKKRIESERESGFKTDKIQQE